QPAEEQVPRDVRRRPDRTVDHRQVVVRGVCHLRDGRRAIALPGPQLGPLAGGHAGEGVTIWTLAAQPVLGDVRRAAPCLLKLRHDTHLPTANAASAPPMSVAAAAATCFAMDGR